MIRLNFDDHEDLIRDISLIEEGAVKRVRMAHIIFLGAHCTNGVFN